MVLNEDTAEKYTACVACDVVHAALQITLDRASDLLDLLDLLSRQRSEKNDFPSQNMA